MLIDEYYPNILPLFRELVERLLDCRLLRLVIDHEEVPLCIRWVCNMAYPGKE